ncbi:hypothetical protein Tco_1377293 [Tanacetum coccineum]
MFTLMFCHVKKKINPNTSIGRLCLGENNQGSLDEGIENKEQWKGPKFQDTATNGEKKERKLCLEYEEKNGEKLLKRELLVSLKGEFYFVKFIINPEEDDVEPSMILGRSFFRLAKGIVDFGNGILTIYLDTTNFDEDSSDDLENIFANVDNVDVTDLLPLEITNIPHFVCNMGKNARIKIKP